MKYTSGNCQWPEGCENTIENQETGLCATHGHQLRKEEKMKSKQKKVYQLPKQKKAIPKVSEKMSKALYIYGKEKKGWLDGKGCAVYPEQMATQIHHKKGRSIDGYADQWAKNNDICLLIDKRFWLPTSDDGHKKITNDSAWAIKNGFSCLRTEILK
jgi:hypothetical protein